MRIFRIGRLMLRTRRSRVMVLPSGYHEPQLTAEGRWPGSLLINVVSVHQRVEDWQWNR